VTESKRRFNNDQGKFYYEKHKLFLYKEDFEKFRNGLSDVMQFIETGEAPEIPAEPEPISENQHLDVEFEDLESEAEKEMEGEDK
jgi:hypothetical protein